MKKSIKIVLIILLSLFGIIFLFKFSFGYLIKTQLKRFTDNSITLDYKSSKTRFLTGSIEFSEALLKFNDVSIDSSSSIFIQSVSFEKFAITRLNLKALLFERSFDIEKVLLSLPVINFLKDTSISRKDIFSKILTPKLLSAKSQSAPFDFEIGEVEIKQGSFQLMEEDRNDFSIGSLNLKLSDIGMDDLKVLNGDLPDLNANFNILVGIYDIQKELPGNAAIVIDSVVYKKDKRLFMTGGLHLSGIKSSTQFAESEIDIITDLISVHGFSLNHFLSSKDLKFDRLTVSNTEIYEKLNYYDEIKISEAKPVPKMKVVSDMVNVFLTDTFHIQNFNYQCNDMVNDSTDFIDDLNLRIYSVRVDSNFLLEDKYLRTIEKSILHSGPIQMHMPENGIDFSCDTLVYSGPGKEQMITNLQLKKYPTLFSENKDQSIFQFITDSVIVWGLDEREWIDSSMVELSVYLQNPRLFGSNVNFGKSGKSNSKGFALDKIVLNQLNLINGSINIKGTLNEIVEVGLLNIDAIDFEIFSRNSKFNEKVNWESLITTVERSKFMIPQKMMFQLEKGVIINNDLDFDGFLFSEVYKIKNFDATSKILPDTSRIYIEKVEFDNFDLLAFIRNKSLTIDKLGITRPKLFKYAAFQKTKDTPPDSISPMILYNRLNKMLPDHISYINIKDFMIKEADLAYQMEQHNLTYRSKFSLDLRSILFDQDIPEGELPELKIKEHEYCMSDVNLESNDFEFVSESVCYNSVEDKMIITNSHSFSKLTKGGNVQNGSIKYNVDFPKIELTDLDFKPLSGGHFSFNLLHIVNPEIYVRIPHEHSNKQSKEKSTGFLPFVYLEDGVSIEDGKIRICLDSENDSTTIEIEKMGLDAHEIDKIIGVNIKQSDSKNLFNYLDFHLNDISLNGSGMKLEIGNVNYDKRSGIISIDPISQEFYAKPGKPEFKGSIKIPGIKIVRPDVMIEDKRIKSYGAVNLLIPDVDVSIESAQTEPFQKSKNVNLSVNDSSLRNFLGKVDFFHIDSTVFNNIGFSHRTIADSGGGSFDIERVSLLVDKLKVDSSHFDFHQKRIAKDIVLQLHDRDVVSADSMYYFHVDNVTYYYSRDKIVIDSFKVTPAFERREFFKRAGLQTDLMQVKFNTAVFEGVDLLSIFESKKLKVNKLTLDKFHLMDHRDQHYPRKENDFKKLPKELLFSLPFALKIDTVQVNNSFLLYGEFVDKSPEPGEIYFTNFDVSIYNLTNISPGINEQDSIYAHITTDIMDESKMTVNMTIPLDNDEDNFWIRGSVEEVDLRKFNSMTENLFGISIVRGKGGVDIPLITFSDTTSKGSIIFEYDKLKLALYNRNKAKLNRGLGSGLIDFMLNGVLIKSNNPTFLGKTRVGDVYARRNKERSFFNYVWKSTMSGLMATMGFYSKDQREEKKERKVEEKIERKDERQFNKLN